MKILLLLIIFFPFSLIAQYTVGDSLLVRTTFTRQFDKEIIDNYLNSNDPIKVKAGLLSISHSEDTSFVDDIINLDYKKYGDYLTFSLGQIGTSEKSTSFLLTKLSQSENEFRNECYEAIGKTGDSLTLHKLLNYSLDDTTDFNDDGLPLAIVNFYVRSINNENSITYLTNKLYNPDIEQDELFNTLFALYRIGPDEKSIPMLKQLLELKNSDMNTPIKLYALDNLRKLETFPFEYELLTKLTSDKSWEIRTESARLLCYFEFSSFSQMKKYLELLDDKNPNVSRAAALSIKNINAKKSVSDSLQTYLTNKIEKEELTKNTTGEIFISTCSLFPYLTYDYIDEYEDVVEQKFIYRLLRSNIQNPEWNFEYLTDNIDDAAEIDLLDLLPALLELQNHFLNNKEHTQFLIDILNGNFPSSISIVADGIERPFIHHYHTILEQIIIDQIFKYLNNTQYIESLISLANLSGKMNENFEHTVLDMLSESKQVSISNFAQRKLGNNIGIIKSDENFNELWENSFKYSGAVITTEKGKFEIIFYPGYAPITTGNFVKLADEQFYNDVLFHRVVPDFVIQAGDTTGTGWGGPGYDIVSEFSLLPFNTNYMGMASSGKDTEGSQW
ncbi:MAG: peptidylprolyl isomerase, partial [Melioribacteraceae bacterium]|nr:peptidylprolyl isomerase [Melioribacteraceae bacterium]